jgi:hypothetical protein
MPVACNWAAPARAASDALLHPSPSAELTKPPIRTGTLARGLCGQDPLEEMYKTRHAMSPHSNFLQIPCSEKHFSVFSSTHFLQRWNVFFKKLIVASQLKLLESANKYVYLVPSYNSLHHFHMAHRNRTHIYSMLVCYPLSLLLGYEWGRGEIPSPPRIITPFLPPPTPNI